MSLKVSLAKSLASAAMVFLFLSGKAMAMEKTPVAVVMETELGTITVEVYPGKAPLSAGDFLRYVDEGHYAREPSGFYRVVRPDNDNGSPKIAVIQGGFLDDSKSLGGIAHETTEMTGLKHLDGTISLGRYAPGTGTAAAFFICVGDQPGLDFGAKRNPDGQGFAAFGRVVKGMDVVRRINALEAKGNDDDPYVKGQILAEPVRILSTKRLAGTDKPNAHP